MKTCFIFVSLFSLWNWNSNIDSNQLRPVCASSMTKLLSNAKLRNGNNYLCDIDSNIKMYAIVDSNKITGWSFVHQSGEIIKTAFAGDPVVGFRYKKHCIKFKLLQAFDYKDIIFEACHPVYL
ncbi:MAG: hypothetical protein HOP11_10065 [Saprospiraceae bacterium]|nr:hypothetical protein [Saprospiraceae bacterium]